MSVSVGVSTAWNYLRDAAVGAGGSYQNMKEIHVGDGGTWRLALYFFRATISSNQTNYNVSTAATAAGWDGAAALCAIITINSGIVIDSASVGTPAFLIPSLPAGSKVSVTNSGEILGADAEDPANGGRAFQTSALTVLVNNADGTIAGGAGFGGGSQGDAINGIANVTLTNNGTISGPQV